MPAMDDADEPTCRFCFGAEDTAQDPLFRPCQCRGTSAWVHVGCLDTWRRTSVNPKSFHGEGMLHTTLYSVFSFSLTRLIDFAECDACKFRYKMGTTMLGDQLNVARLLSTAGAIHLLAFSALCCIIFVAGFVAKMFDSSLDWIEVLRCFNIDHIIAGATTTGLGSLTGYFTSAIGLTGLNNARFVVGDFIPARVGESGHDGMVGTVLFVAAVVAGLCFAFCWIYGQLEEWARATARHAQHMCGQPIEHDTSVSSSAVPDGMWAFAFRM